MIEVGFSKVMPMSEVDQRQWAHNRMKGPVWSSPVAVTARAAKQIGQEKQLRVHLYIVVGH